MYIHLTSPSVISDLYQILSVPVLLAAFAVNMWPYPVVSFKRFFKFLYMKFPKLDLFLFVVKSFQKLFNFSNRSLNMIKPFHTFRYLTILSIIEPFDNWNTAHSPVHMYTADVCIYICNPCYPLNKKCGSFCQQCCPFLNIHRKSLPQDFMFSLI